MTEAEMIKDMIQTARIECETARSLWQSGGQSRRDPEFGKKVAPKRQWIDKRALRKMWEAGVEVEDIAASQKCAEDSVFRAARKLGLAKRPRRAAK